MVSETSRRRADIRRRFSSDCAARAAQSRTVRSRGAARHLVALSGPARAVRPLPPSPCYQPLLGPGRKLSANRRARPGPTPMLLMAFGALGLAPCAVSPVKRAKFGAIAAGRPSPRTTSPNRGRHPQTTAIPVAAAEADVAARAEGVQPPPAALSRLPGYPKQGYPPQKAGGQTLASSNKSCRRPPVRRRSRPATAE